MIGRSVLVEVVRDSVEFSVPSLVPRDLRVPFELRINRVISIVGPRRAGKTFYMFQLIGELSRHVDRSRLLYVNFEDVRLEGASARDFVKLIDVYYEIFPENRKCKVWMFFDEVQNVEGWEIVVRSLIDMRNVQVYATGSSSRLLSAEIATQLRGRTLTYCIYPFSFREFLRARDFEPPDYMSSAERSRVMNLLNEYLLWGGYPETVLEPKLRRKILDEIWEVTISRDIIERWNIRNVKVLKLLVRALKESKEFSVHAFYNYLKSIGIRVGKDTIYNYMEYLSDAMIVFPLKKFSFSYKTIEMSIPKIFLVDNGLYGNTRDKSHLMENIVFMELKRRGYVENRNLFYWKNNRGLEIDFITTKNGRVNQLIQVTYELKEYDRRQFNREVKPLIKASKTLQCRNALIITWDQEDTIKHGNLTIKVKPLWKWLLESN